MKKWLVLSLSVLLLSGCIAPPQGLEADKFTVQSVKKIESDDYRCECKKVRLGGKVLSATALKDKTKVEVLSLPVSIFSAKPIVESAAEGRFIVYLAGFIDPESLKEQYITVAGVLKGTETGKIDQADYQYPVVEATNYRQWRLVQEYYYDPMDWDDYWYERHFGFGLRYRLFPPQPKLRYTLY